MKKLVILSIFISTTTLGQFFESYDYSEESPELYSQEFFNEPDQGTDNTVDPTPGGVDEVPIDNWQYLLSGFGIVIAGYFLSRHKKLA